MSQPQAAREELRRRWCEHSDSLFDRFFPAESPQPLPSFTQLEDRAASLARDMASWLLEQRVAPATLAPAEVQPHCPRCGRPGDRIDPPDGKPFKRTLTTRAGDVELAREKRRCTACRVVFFPPR